MPEPEETLDVGAAAERLREALALQYRSALNYTLAAGSMIGLEYQALAGEFWRFAAAELEDARHLIEKLGALGEAPTTKVPEPEWDADPKTNVRRLVTSEAEAIEALQQAIEPTGREGRSEALEHRLEHIIMRKQEQVDLLVRALGGPDAVG